MDEFFNWNFRLRRNDIIALQNIKLSENDLKNDLWCNGNNSYIHFSIHSKTIMIGGSSRTLKHQFTQSYFFII